MTPSQRMKRRIALLFWRPFNPLARSLAGVAPWWVVLETTGQRSGRARRVPLARGPVDDSTAWLISVHGAHASYAHNIAADQSVRLRLHGRWRRGRATLVPLDDAILRRFNRYARLAAGRTGIDPMLVRVELE